MMVSSLIRPMKRWNVNLVKFCEDSMNKLFRVIHIPWNLAQIAGNPNGKITSTKRVHRTDISVERVEKSKERASEKERKKDDDDDDIMTTVNQIDSISRTRSCSLNCFEFASL